MHGVPLHIFTFATACRASDFAMVTGATFAAPFAAAGAAPSPVVAAGLLVAALAKSSQFPLISLFARSMEGNKTLY